MADGRRVLGLGPTALVAAVPITAAVAHAHPAPAAAADDQPVQESGAIAGSTAAFALEAGEVVPQLPPVRQIGLKAQVGGTI